MAPFLAGFPLQVSAAEGMIGHDHKFMQQRPPLSMILRQPRTLVRGPPEAQPCDRMEEARGVRLSPRSRKTYGLIGELGAFSPGLKPGHCKIKRSRGFENPLPRTEVRGWHGSCL
jgi:hypothetical protein